MLWPGAGSLMLLCGWNWTCPGDSGRLRKHDGKRGSGQRERWDSENQGHVRGVASPGLRAESPAGARGPSWPCSGSASWALALQTVGRVLAPADCSLGQVGQPLCAWD